MKTKLHCDFHFEAAHLMPNFPEGHPNTRIHGHSYMGEVVLEGPVDPKTGVIVEIDQLKNALKPVLSSLDHHLLNDVPGLGLPSAENIAAYMYRELRKTLPHLKEVWIKRPTLGMSVCYSE